MTDLLFVQREKQYFVQYTELEGGPWITDTETFRTEESARERAKEFAVGKAGVSARVLLEVAIIG